MIVFWLRDIFPTFRFQFESDLNFFLCFPVDHFYIFSGTKLGFASVFKWRISLNPMEKACYVGEALSPVKISS